MGNPANAIKLVKSAANIAKQGPKLMSAASGLVKMHEDTFPIAKAGLLSLQKNIPQAYHFYRPTLDFFNGALRIPQVSSPYKWDRHYDYIQLGDYLPSTQYNVLRSLTRDRIFNNVTPYDFEIGIFDPQKSPAEMWKLPYFDPTRKELLESIKRDDTTPIKIVVPVYEKPGWTGYNYEDDSKGQTTVISAVLGDQGTFLAPEHHFHSTAAHEAVGHRYDLILDDTSYSKTSPFFTFKENTPLKLYYSELASPKSKDGFYFYNDLYETPSSTEANEIRATAKQLLLQKLNELLYLGHDLWKLYQNNQLENELAKSIDKIDVPLLSKLFKNVYSGYSDDYDFALDVMTDADKQKWLNQWKWVLKTLPFAATPFLIRNMSPDDSTSSNVEIKREGGVIHINPKNKGKFTDYCGGNVTQSCIQEGKNSTNPVIKKRAVFADNARKWKHGQGGFINYINLFKNGR